MTITTTSLVNTQLPINVKIGVNGVVQVEAQGEPGDSLQAVLAAAAEELELVATDFIDDNGALHETVTILNQGGMRRATNASETVAPGDTVVVNQPNKNG